MNSELYIKQKLEKLPPNGGANVYTSQDLQNNEKNKKRLLNSAKLIGQGIEFDHVIGLIDISLFHDGKEGVVFTGTDAYVRESFADVIHINLENFDDIEYKQITKFNEKGKATEAYRLSFTEDGAVKEYITEVELTGLVYELTANVLSDFNNVVKNVESTEQDITLAELGEDAVLAYLKVVYRYLKADDKIEYREMLNMANLLAQLEVSDSLEEKFRDYRFDRDDHEDMSTAVNHLKALVPEGSQQIIFQSLINDLLGMKNDEELNDWENDDDLFQLMDLLLVTKKQAEFFVRNQQLNNRQIKERLEDNQIKKLSRDLTVFGTGLNISAKALTATGALLSVSSGGLLLVAVGIFAGYEGIRYMMSGNSKSKYSIRNELLQRHVLRLTQAQQFLMSDINRFVAEMNELMADKNAVLNQYDKIKIKLIQISEATKAEQKAKSEAAKLTREQLLSELPAELIIKKLDSLVKTKKSGEKVANIIKLAYPDNKLNENLVTRDLERIQVILTQIGYIKTDA